MSSSDRRTFLLALAALPVAGCGFTPVYKEGGAGRALIGRLRFNLIESRAGFVLLETLESRFGSADTAEFDVNIELMTEEKVLTLTAATSLDRITLKGAAVVHVTRHADQSEVFTDKLRETVHYTSSAETGVSRQAKLDAHDRLARALGEKIILRLSSTARDWAG